MLPAAGPADGQAASTFSILTLPRMAIVSTSPVRSVWLGLVTRVRLTRTLPFDTNWAAKVRDLTIRENQSHLSRRWTSGFLAAG